MGHAFLSQGRLSRDELSVSTSRCHLTGHLASNLWIFGDTRHSVHSSTQLPSCEDISALARCWCYFAPKPLQRFGILHWAVPSARSKDESWEAGNLSEWSSYPSAGRPCTTWCSFPIDKSLSKTKSIPNGKTSFLVVPLHLLSKGYFCVHRILRWPTVTHILA